jgi:hypothetical protein
MRPYQIVATERILSRITISTNYKSTGTAEGGGYIWHTTGSGKTLASFKTAQIAAKFETIDKVLFVVDRKDLDYQTMKEYDRFEKGAANSNTSTRILQKQLESDNVRIIVPRVSDCLRRPPNDHFTGQHLAQQLLFACHYLLDKMPSGNATGFMEGHIHSRQTRLAVFTERLVIKTHDRYVFGYLHASLAPRVHCSDRHFVIGDKSGCRHAFCAEPLIHLARQLQSDMVLLSLPIRE